MTKPCSGACPWAQRFKPRVESISESGRRVANEWRSCWSRLSARVPQLLTSSNRTVPGIFPACYSMQRRECSIDIASMTKKAIRTPSRVFSRRARMVPHRSSIQRLLAGPTALGAASISKAKSSTKCMLGRLRGQERGRRPHASWKPSPGWELPSWRSCRSPILPVRLAGDTTV